MNSKPVVCGQRSPRIGGRMGGPFFLAAALLHVFAIMALCLSPVSAGEPAILQDIEYSSLPGNKVQITLTASDMLGEPTSFSTDNPARIALDFAGVKSGLKQKTQAIGVGVVRSVTAIEAGGRTRVVINLVASSAHEVAVDGNKAIVIVEGGSVASAAATQSRPSKPMMEASTDRAVQNIDFRRGGSGEGRVIITLSDPATLVDMREEAGRIVLDFLDASLPHELMRKYDVTDFATPVQTIEASAADDNTRMVITPAGDYEHLAYQADNLYTVEFRPLTKQEQEQIRKEKQVYTGERLSLNFQDIEVRAVLQLLADFTGLNMVTSDTVGGRLTLRLKNVPWDQALDIILKTKGLSMRRTDNVVLVAPTEEIAAREKLELESEKQIEELAPLYSEFIQINYAKADELAALIKTEDNNLLSPRGNVTIDERTNTLLVQDTAAKLEDIRRLVSMLDVPVRQVLIESRIVVANNDFTKDLGVRFGFGRSQSIGGHDINIDGGRPGFLNDTADFNTGSFMGYDGVAVRTGSQRQLQVNLPAASPSGALNLLIGRLGSYLLQLELSAMQREGKGEVISSPRVITSDQSTATIKQGVEIPYQEASSSGATSVSFKEAVLELEVTPQITPDDRVIMELQISKDAPDFTNAVLGTPSLTTREVETTVLVDNGETVVLGGVFERTKADNTEKVPLFGDLPYVGGLFKQNLVKDENRELLIFVTPKILKDSLALP
ncbi:type IV pilus secretin PilQ [Pseudomonadota bacterium]